MANGYIEIDQELCKGCQLCISFCTKGSIYIAQNLNTAGYQPVTFDGSSSTDNLGIVSYEWTFNDGTDDITLYGAAPSHTFSVPGVYTVTLNVTDAVGRWDPQAEIVEIEADRSGSRATVSMTVATTTSDLQPAWKLADAISTEHEIEIDLDVRYQRESTDAASTS